ncbi:unnamed protein product [Schistosoma mattheei]|uniref:Uncharacterized protein n=1 Tax=Schistosoma mattheei TaxID=31246 RepID=A0AA85BUY5_9TREM|nr:unnamed protein product [Schistosoma mattheei]
MFNYKIYYNKLNGYYIILGILIIPILLILLQRYFVHEYDGIHEVLKIYSTFYELKRDLINGKLKLNTEKIKEIVIYGETTVPINTELRGCLVSNCVLHQTKWRSYYAEMVIITNGHFPNVKNNQNQVWLAYHYEAPPHSRLNKLLGEKVSICVYFAVLYISLLYIT